MKPVRNFPLFLFLMLLAGCSKTDSPNPTIDPNSSKSSEKKITATPVIIGINAVSDSYDPAAFTYTLTVPSGTNLKSLQLDVAISLKATISPNPSTARDYTNPISYTVTAEDGSKQVYRIAISPMKDEIPTGASCLVSRIENRDTKEYFDFKYDTQGRVSEITKVVLYDSRILDPWETLTCTYGGPAGELTEIQIKHISYRDQYWNTSDLYRFTYQNGKLVLISSKKNGEAPVDESVIVNNNNQLIQYNELLTRSYFPESICHTYSYRNGAMTKATRCESTEGADRSMVYGDTRHFLSAQINRPALLFVFKVFAEEYDTIKFLPFYYGYLAPTTVYFSSSTACDASYVTNSQKFPIQINLTYKWNQNTAFPEQKKITYAITYAQCY